MRTTRDDALALDRADPLAFARERFELPPGVIYLDGNSLGARPRATPAALARVAEEEWGRGLIRSWNRAGWIDAPLRIGGAIARLVGAAADEVAVTDSTSVNLYKLASAALALRPGRRVILSEPGNFPTDLYMLQGLCEQLGGSAELRLVPRDRIAEALDETVAVLVLTHVHYTSGQVFDMVALTARAHAAGVLVLWDLSHSTGALPVDLNGAQADLAVGCGYKYLNGGPGAPAFAYVARRHQPVLRQPLAGWMGHAAPFAFVDDYQPADGIARVLCGTPSVLAMAALECGVATFDGVEMADVRAKSMSLSSLFLDRLEDRLPGMFELVSPRSASDRGSHVSLAHPNGYAIMAALIEAGVIGDFRAPDRLRFGFTPLYLSHAEVFDAVEILAGIVERETWRAPRFAVRQAVT
jgi:kynureninase